MKPLLKLANTYGAGRLTDHEFLHRTKAIVEANINPQVYAEAALLLCRVNQGHDALSVLKGAKLDRPDSDYDEKELALGRKHELEHTTNHQAADIIAKDHLDEDPAYYSKLIKSVEHASTAEPANAS